MDLYVKYEFCYNDLNAYYNDKLGAYCFCSFDKIYDYDKVLCIFCDYNSMISLPNLPNLLILLTVNIID